MSTVRVPQNGLSKRLKGQPVFPGQSSRPGSSTSSYSIPSPRITSGRASPNGLAAGLTHRGLKRGNASASNSSLASSASSLNGQSSSGGGAGSSTAANIYHLIRHLKSKHPVVQTVSDIVRQTGISDPNVFSVLKKNERVIYDPSKDTYKYRATYDLSSKDDVLKLLRQRRDIGGMDVVELKESWSDVTAAVEELVKEDKILVIRRKDEPRIIFYNEAHGVQGLRRIDTLIDEEFKSAWDSLRVPDEVDMTKELEKSGLKSMDIVQDKSNDNKRKKAKKKRSGGYKRIKITNTHLSSLGIDLKKELASSKS